jgi:hypothetical protein
MGFVLGFRFIIIKHAMYARSFAVSSVEPKTTTPSDRTGGGIQMWRLMVLGLSQAFSAGHTRDDVSLSNAIRHHQHGGLYLCPMF